MKMRRFVSLAASCSIVTAVAIALFVAPGCDGQESQAPQAGAAPAGIVNVTCPIMGSRIDPANVPAVLTRTFKGQKIGFCCAGCPTAWDKLSDEEKVAKLAIAKPAQPG